MKRIRNLSDSRGSATVEFAIIAPVLVMMIWGMFQIAVLFEANAGIQQALGQGARFATVYNPATGGPHTSTEVLNLITSSKFGVGGGTFYSTCPQTCIDTTNAAPANGAYWDIQVSYLVSTNFLFFRGPTITMVRSKRVYLST
jgi:hypothetical protein